MSDWESDEEILPPTNQKPNRNFDRPPPGHRVEPFDGYRNDSFGSSGSGGRGRARGRGSGYSGNSFGSGDRGDRRGGFVDRNGHGDRGDRRGGGGFGDRRPGERNGFGGNFNSRSDFRDSFKPRGGFSGLCFSCGEEGHSKAFCPRNGGVNGCGNGDSRHRGMDRGGFKFGHGGSQQRDYTENRGPHGSAYVPEEELCENLYKSGISTGINFEKYEDLKVEVTGSNKIDTYLSSFKDANLRQLVQDNIEKSGYAVPTPVQKRSIPIILGGRDLMSCAQTGSGKTAAFLLPIIHKLLEDGTEVKAAERPQKPECLIVTPTRELAIQIKDEARKFSNGSTLQPVVIYGGTATNNQRHHLLNGANIVVATPGRLKQFMEESVISFSSLKYLVLDEADRMLDMGFMRDIERLIRHPSMPHKTKRQTLMFSATFPVEIQQAAANFLNDYLFLKVGIVGGANSDILQTVFKVSKFEKRDKLVEILNDLKERGEKVLVFVEKKKNTDFLATYLSQEKFKATTIHGDRLQDERERALKDFKSGRMTILVATAVAARGLDIPLVRHVINYDLPSTIDEYVHRIGRTGRVGNTGTATSFYDVEQDGQIAKDLVKVLSESHQTVDEWLSQEATRNLGGGGFNIGGYGSHDIRNSNNYSAPVEIEEEESWD